MRSEMPCRDWQNDPANGHSASHAGDILALLVELTAGRLVGRAAGSLLGAVHLSYYSLEDSNYA